MVDFCKVGRISEKCQLKLVPENSGAILVMVGRLERQLVMISVPTC
jgi:hypothetical protein